MKKYIMILVSIIMIMGLIGCEKKDMSYKEISMEEAVAIMATEENYIILDVRTTEEFAEKHIPNAINIPNETIGSEELAELPDKNQLILVYCRSGNRSKQASEKLAALGYTNIYEFGGINDWTGELEIYGESNIRTHL